MHLVTIDSEFSDVTAPYLISVHITLRVFEMQALTKTLYTVCAQCYLRKLCSALDNTLKLVFVSARHDRAVTLT